jgi:hypothetical protein
MMAAISLHQLAEAFATISTLAMRVSLALALPETIGQ